MTLTDKIEDLRKRQLALRRAENFREAEQRTRDETDIAIEARDLLFGDVAEVLPLLLAASVPFISLRGILESLPNKLPDDTPLRDVMPGAHPTMRHLRALGAAIDKLTGGMKASQIEDLLAKLKAHPTGGTT